MLKKESDLSRDLAAQWSQERFRLSFLLHRPNKENDDDRSTINANSTFNRWSRFIYWYLHTVTTVTFQRRDLDDASIQRKSAKLTGKHIVLFWNILMPNMGGEWTEASICRRKHVYQLGHRLNQLLDFVFVLGTFVTKFK